MSDLYKNVASPSFVMHEDLLRKNLELISRVRNEADVTIIMALKGFSMWSAFPIVKEYIKTCTASSLHEARLCFEEMGARAHCYSVAYHPNEFAELCKITDHIVFNSIAQFQQFYPQTLNSDHAISCGVRVNPEFSPVKTDLYNPCGLGSRFGVVAEQMPDKLPEGLDGFHFHVLCESTSYDLETALLSLETHFGKYLHQLKWVNMGGGHLMTRKGYDVEHLIEILKAFKAKYNLEIILEPGSAFAWETGVLVSSVMDIVNNRGIKTAILDVSFTAHMPDTLEMPYRPGIIGASDPISESKSEHLYRLGGISCLSGDFMDAYDFGRTLQVGDSIVFLDMIHYTMVKTTTFNGVKHPSIAILQKDGTLNVHKEFKYEDYRNRLS